MIARAQAHRGRGTKPQQFHRRTGRYRLHYCPNCGMPLKAFRRIFITLCKAMKTTPNLPPGHICMHCGLDMRTVRITS